MIHVTQLIEVLVLGRSLLCYFCQRLNVPARCGVYDSRHASDASRSSAPTDTGVGASKAVVKLEFHVLDELGRLETLLEHSGKRFVMGLVLQST